MRPRACRHHLGGPSRQLLTLLPRLKPPPFDLGPEGQRGLSPRSRKGSTTQPAERGSPQINAEKHQSAATLEQRERGSLETPGPQAGPWALTGTWVLWAGPCLPVSRGLYSCRGRGRPESGLIKPHTPGMGRTAGPQPQGRGSGSGGWSAAARRPCTAAPAVSGLTSGLATESHLALQHQRHRKHPGSADLGLPRWQESELCSPRFPAKFPGQREAAGASPLPLGWVSPLVG